MILEGIEGVSFFCCIFVTNYIGFIYCKKYSKNLLTSNFGTVIILSVICFIYFYYLVINYCFVGKELLVFLVIEKIEGSVGMVI